MTDATAGESMGAVDAASAEPSTGRRLRTGGYCAGCGTWDEHGPTCVSCGYDFTGGDGSTSEA